VSAPRRRLQAACALLAGCAFTAACSAPETTELPILHGAEIVLPVFDSLRVRLVDGAGEVFGPDDVLVARVGLTEWQMIDDFDGDGRTDAVVAGWSSGGGSGTFVELMHFVLRGDENSDVVWVWSGAVPLGDRVQVRGLSTTDRGIEAQLTVHGTEDPLCCPTVDVVRQYEISDGILREAGR
jgi:hypothetical protein